MTLHHVKRQSFDRPKSRVSGDLKPKKTAGSRGAPVPAEAQAHLDLLKRALKQPVEALTIEQRRVAEACKSFRYRSYQGAAVGMAAAAGLKENADEYIAFSQQSFWKGAARKPKGNSAGEDILRWSLIFTFQARSEQDMKRILVYVNRLQPLFDKGNDPALIPDLLAKSGGFQGLGDMADRYASPDKKAEKGSEASSEDDEADPETPEATVSVPKPPATKTPSEDDEADPDTPDATVSKPKRSATQSSDTLGSSVVGFEELILWCKRQIINTACELAEGELGNIVFRRKGRKDGLVRFVVERYSKVP